VHYVPFAGIDRIPCLCEFSECFGLSRLCKECTLELLENYANQVQGVHKNSISSSGGACQVGTPELVKDQKG
jgi:hypothetical protein